MTGQALLQRMQLLGQAAEQRQLFADRDVFVEGVRQALYASKIAAYAQGFDLIRAGAAEYGWDIDLGAMARQTIADLRLADAAPASEGSEACLAQIDNLEDHLEDIERRLIMQALEETRWNRTAAAQRLGLTFRSMRYRLKKLGID